MKKIIIIGAGAMGSAFAVPCVDNKNDVTVVGTHLENELINSINSKNKIHPSLKTQLPKEINFEKFLFLIFILSFNFFNCSNAKTAEISDGKKL